jgi:hypothetical protein
MNPVYQLVVIVTMGTYQEYRPVVRLYAYSDNRAECIAESKSELEDVRPYFLKGWKYQVVCMTEKRWNAIHSGPEKENKNPQKSAP